MSTKNNNVSTAATALILCLVCSVMVSAVAVGLKPKQQENARLDLNKNILMAADMYDPETESADVIAERFADFLKYAWSTYKQVNLQQSKKLWRLVSVMSIATMSQKQPAHPSLSTSLTNDIAKIEANQIFAKVYLAKDANGQLEQIVLPIHGAGLWGPIFGL